MRMRLPRPVPLSIALVLAATFADSAYAQAPVPGEKWRQSTKMELDGVPMPMPGMSSEICVPIGKAAEALSGPPPQQTNCTTSNVTQSGSTFSADITCTGKDAFTGRIETTQASPTKFSGRMTMNSKEGTMVMRMESEKIGGACDAAEAERRMNQLMAKAEADVAAMRAKECAAGLQQIRKSPREAASASYLFLGQSTPGAKVPPTCTDPAQKKEWCGAVGSRPGFRGLSSYDRNIKRNEQATGGSGALGQPLTLPALSACGLATNAAGVEAYRKKLVDAAEVERDWGFFLAEATAERSDAIGKAQCTGRAFTEAKDPVYADFCTRWGARMAGKEPVDDGASVAGGGGAAGSSAAGGAQGAASTGTVDATQPAGQTAPATPVDAAKEAMKKGGKLLKGILGGGT